MICTLRGGKISRGNLREESTDTVRIDNMCGTAVADTPCGLSPSCYVVWKLDFRGPIGTSAK